MVGNLAFWPQQDIVEAMGASNKVAYNINKKTLETPQRLTKMEICLRLTLALGPSCLQLHRKSLNQSTWALMVRKWYKMT